MLTDLTYRITLQSVIMVPSSQMRVSSSHKTEICFFLLYCILELQDNFDVHLHKQSLVMSFFLWYTTIDQGVLFSRNISRKNNLTCIQRIQEDIYYISFPSVFL